MTNVKIADAYFLCESEEEANVLMTKAMKYAGKHGYFIEGKYFSRSDENWRSNSCLLDKVIASLAERKVKLLIFSSRRALGDDEMLRRERRNNIIKAGARLTFIQNKREQVYALNWLNSVKDYNSYASDWKIHIGAIKKPVPHQITNGARPYGYDSQNGYYVINEEQAKFVRFIFELYISGLNASAISKRLKATGCEHRFPVSSIMSILQNEHYAGIDRGEAGTVPAIVTNRQWLTAKGIRMKRKADEPVMYMFLLDNIRFTMNKTSIKLRPNRLVRNGASPVYSGRFGDMNISVDAEKLESLVTEAILKNLSEALDAECTEVLMFTDTKRAETLQYIEETQKQRGEIEKKFDTVFGSHRPMINSGDIQKFDELKLLTDEADKKLRRAEIVLELCSQDRADIRAFFERAKQLPSMHRSEARFFLNRLISRVAVEENQTVIDCNYNGGRKIIISDTRELIKSAANKCVFR